MLGKGNAFRLPLIGVFGLQNGSRRRSPGGVFLFLIKGDSSITADMKNRIFIDDIKQARRAVKQKKKAEHRQHVEKLRKALEEGNFSPIAVLCLLPTFYRNQFRLCADREKKDFESFKIHFIHIRFFLFVFIRYIKTFHSLISSIAFSSQELTSYS